MRKQLILCATMALACLFLLPACTDESQESGSGSGQGDATLGKKLERITRIAYENVDDQYTVGSKCDYTPTMKGNLLTTIVVHNHYDGKNETLNLNYWGTSVTDITSDKNGQREKFLYFSYHEDQSTEVIDIRNLRKYTVRYNRDGKIESVRKVLGTKISTYQLFWQDDNVVGVHETTRYNDGTIYEDNYAYTYDDKTSAFAGLSLLAYLDEMTEVTLSYFSKNNLIRCTNDDGTKDYHCDYSADGGYPVSVSAGDVMTFFKFQEEPAPEIPLTHTITVHTSNGKLGTTRGQGVYLPGKQVILEAVPANNCRFLQWSNGSRENPLVFTATQDETINALFDIIDPNEQYTITALANNPDWGTVTGGGTYAPGAEVTLTATPAEGYQFVNWETPDGTSARNPYTFFVNGNATCTANFEPIPNGTLQVTFGRSRWTATNIDAQYNNRALRIIANTDTLSLETLPIVDLYYQWDGNPTTGTYEGYTTFSDGIFQIQPPRVWYYEDTISYYGDAQGNPQPSGDWWSTSVTFTVTAISLSRQTISFTLTATMKNMLHGNYENERLTMKAIDLPFTRP